MAGVGDTDTDTKLRQDGGWGGGGGLTVGEWSEMGRSDMARKEATHANPKLQPVITQNNQKGFEDAAGHRSRRG